MAEVDGVSRAGLSSQGSSKDECSMNLHRPTSARSQDVRHVLARTFGDMFVKEPISKDTIRNLITTRSGDDEYHERYVNDLQKVLNETESRLNKIEALEKHIMQAEAKALNADERFIADASSGNQIQLGIPTGVNHMRSCLDYDLLKKNHLVTPDQYANYSLATVPKPQAPSQPLYLKPTENYQNATKGRPEMRERLKRSRFVQSADAGQRSSGVGSNIHINQFNKNSIDEDTESIDLIRPGSEGAADALESILTSRSAGAISTKRRKSKAKRTWTEQMAVEQRQMERAKLEQLQNKTNYLKNPRFNTAETKLITNYSRPSAKEINVKADENTATDVEFNQVFLPHPAVVTFTSYQVGQVYQTVLDLKNISTSMRPVRLLPTKTNYFSVGLGQFPGEQGLVASGMSAQFSIRFMPDSLGEFRDEIVVQSQSNEMTVKIVACRPPPSLTLPKKINVGECLIGGSKLAKYIIKNNGGEGKFCIIDKQRWPVTNFKSTVNPMMLDMGPFQMRPAVFELAHRESCQIEVLFRPTSLQDCHQDLIILCDNCHMQSYELTGTGQMASAEFVAVDGGTSEPLPGELCDVSAHKMIRFDELNPYTYTQKTLIISNPTNVALPFEWVVVKPDIVTETWEGKEPANRTQARTLDIDSPFSIDPQNGILDASGIANFTLTFAPPEVMKGHSVLHLVLPAVPHRQQTGSAAAEPSDALVDITALELEVKADCVPLKVALQPYAIYVNGKSLVGTTVRRQFSFNNNSVSPAIFQWESSADSENIIEVTPALGEIEPGCSSHMEVSITGCKVGKNHEVLLCYVKNLAEPIALHVDFEVKGPELYLDEADVNFGLIRYGTSVSSTLTLHNDSQIPATFKISENLPANAEAQKRKSEFVFEPSHGTLAPLQTMKINVSFYPQRCQLVRTFFQLLVDGGGESSKLNSATATSEFTVAVRADVQSPEVCLLNCNLNIAKLFVNMPMTQNITVINKTQLRTQYTWGKPVGSQASLCTVRLAETGELAPREDTEIEIEFTAHAQMDITDLVLPLYVAGMDEPQLLSITANVEGLQIAYAVQSSPNMPNFDEASADSTLIEFGDVNVMQSYTQYIYLRNKTSIPTTYHLALNNFGANPATLESLANAKAAAVTMNSRDLMLKKTPNIADPDSKSKERAHIELQTRLLKTNRGLVIMADPAKGQLAPYQELVVSLSLFSDMWGEYDDVLTCRVGELSPYDIPVHAKVVGSPLKFHMSALTGDPMLRFGTHPSNSKPVKRTVRINNHSPCDVRLDWQVFNIQPSDEQLVDFVVSYGVSFPYKDQDGNEITHRAPIIEPPPPRPPTEAIPNTPDSTIAGSQRGISQLSRMSSPLITPGLDTDRTDTLIDTARDDYLDENGEPFVKVVIRAHDGHESGKPFAIKPLQLVIPARDKAFVEVTFDPESGNPMGAVCDSYILGYMNLEEKDIIEDCKFSRVIGYEMQPIRLNLAGHIIPALLTNEFMDDEGLRFRTVASDLLPSPGSQPLAPLGSLNSLYCVQNGTKLTNLTQALLTFELEVHPPFVFTRSVPSLSPDNTISLRPSESCEVYMDFCLSPELLSVIRGGGEPDKRVTVDQAERMIHVQDKLKINFISGAVQELPLHASIACPSLMVDKEQLNFETCLVGQSKQMTIILKNRTMSSTTWQIRSLDRKTDSSFVIEPMSGHLDAHITHVTKSEQLITVNFKSIDAAVHQAEFLLEGCLGEEPIQLLFTGQGSFDEKHEDLLNLIVR